MLKLVILSWLICVTINYFVQQNPRWSSCIVRHQNRSSPFSSIKHFVKYGLPSPAPKPLKTFLRPPSNRQLVLSWWTNKGEPATNHSDICKARQYRSLGHLRRKSFSYKRATKNHSRYTHNKAFSCPQLPYQEYHLNTFVHISSIYNFGPNPLEGLEAFSFQTQL